MFLLQMKVVWLELSVWEGNVNAMEKDRSYCLKNFMVREYQRTKYITISEIIPIGDIGAVAEQGDRDDEEWVINNMRVAGVPYFDTYKSCLQCVGCEDHHVCVWLHSLQSGY